MMNKKTFTVLFVLCLSLQLSCISKESKALDAFEKGKTLKQEGLHMQAMTEFNKCFELLSAEHSIIKEIVSYTIDIDCDKCNGSGKVRTTCPHCQGAGKTRCTWSENWKNTTGGGTCNMWCSSGIIKQNDAWYSCIGYQIKGEIRAGDRCQWCRGTGIMPCDVIGGCGGNITTGKPGTGYIKKECPDCNGSGKKSVNYIKHFNKQG